MELTYTHFVLFHAATGTLALLSGTLAAIFKKGGRPHVLSGRFFLIFMGISALSAVVLTFIKSNPFLLGIGLFTLYLLASGWNWIRRTSFSAKSVASKAIGALGVSFSAFMVYTAFAPPERNVILLVFGGILAIMALVDLFRKHTPAKTARLHGGRMGGAFIASVTAFLVVNNDFMPPLIAWLGPTVVGSPLIALGIRNFYRRKR